MKLPDQLTCFTCGRQVDIDECEIFECASDENVRSVECHQCVPPDELEEDSDL